MSKKLKLVIIVMSLSLLCISCVSKSTLEPPTSAPSNLTAEKAGIYAAGNSQLCFLDKGMYEAQPILANSVNIFYTDFESLSRIYLCNRPECPHNNESCASYMPMSGTWPPFLFSAGNKLLVAFPSATEQSNPYIVIMNKDASEKKVLLELPSNETMNGFFCADDKFIYFDVTSVTQDGTAQHFLKRASLNSGELSTLTSLDTENTFYSLVSAFDNQLCFVSNPTENDNIIHYILMNPYAPSFETEIHQYTPGDTVSMTDGAYIYDTDTVNHTLTKKNMRDKSETVVNYQVKDEYRVLGVTKSFPNHVILEMAGPVKNGEYDISSTIVDFETKKLHELFLKTPYNNRPIYVLGMYQEMLCVATDYSEYYITQVSSTGATSEVGYISNKYALITQDDFLSSMPNYEIITNVF